MTLFLLITKPKNGSVMKKGKELELVITAIEKGLSPDATVEHDVFLPVLTSNNGRTRQIDVSIRQGKPPRETLTIVEVQDRNSPVDINTFNGWLCKVEEVGAQHLMVVSRKPFPESIKEKAEQSGNKVFLIHIKEAIPDEIPSDFINFFIDYHDFTLLDDSSLRVKVKKGMIDKHSLKPELITASDRRFCIDGKNLIDINALFRLALGYEEQSSLKGKMSEKLYFGNMAEKDVPEGDYVIVNTDLHVSVSEQLIPCAVLLSANYRYVHITKKMKVLSYEQSNHGNLDVWIFDEKIKTDEGVYTCRIPIRRDDDGLFFILGTFINGPTNYKAEIIAATDRFI